MDWQSLKKDIAKELGVQGLSQFALWVPWGTIGGAIMTFFMSSQGLFLPYAILAGATFAALVKYLVSGVPAAAGRFRAMLWGMFVFGALIATGSAVALWKTHSNAVPTFPGFQLSAQDLKQLGTPVSSAQTSANGYQAGHENAYVLWLSHSRTFYFLSTRTQKWLEHEEKETRVGAEYFDDGFLRSSFKDIPKGKMPPYAGVAKLWESDPKKWRPILGWREWDSVFEVMTIQNFENGKVIGSGIINPAIDRSIAFIVWNDGSWERKDASGTSPKRAPRIDNVAVWRPSK